MEVTVYEEGATPIVKNEQYERLLEEIDATWSEGMRLILNTASKVDYMVGRAMVNFIQNNGVSPTALVRQVSIDMKKSPRSVWSTYMLWKDRPDYDAVVSEVAQITGYTEPSLSAMRHALLGEGGQSAFNLEAVVERILKKYGAEKALQIAEQIRIKTSS
jgi:alkylated DNA repair dioxygenase AlkB